MKGVNRRIFGRSFFLETLWNYEKMQNLGFSFCIYPALERLCPDEDDRKRVLSRHLEPVNTHPSMAPLLAGLTARLEHDLEPTTIIPYRKRAMSALAAHGDRIFWTRVKPLAAAWASLVSLCFFGSALGSVLLLVVYNVPQLVMRAGGFKWGWKNGLQVLHAFKSPRAEAAMLVMREATALGLGLLAGAVVITSGRFCEGTIAQPILAAGLPVVGGIALLLLRRRVPLTAVIYICALATVALFVILHGGTSVG
ncbi:MAG: PTS system mannose/fructose/sorbose family transporter subunit IID [Desulfomonilaceae bacterium]